MTAKKSVHLKGGLKILVLTSCYFTLRFKVNAAATEWTDIRSLMNSEKVRSF